MKSVIQQERAMPKNKLHISVFLSAPSDMSEECEAIEQIVQEQNRMLSTRNSVHVDLLHWKKFARPGFADRPQGVINDQTPADYDIFVGLMHTRFGSSTGLYGSGTEEEFERAYLRFNERKNSVQIMFYFKTASASLSGFGLDDIEQLKSVLNFKAKLGPKGGLYFEFGDLEQFESDFRVHLAQAVEECIKRSDFEVNAAAPAVSLEVVETEASDTSDDGLFDFIETAEKELNDATKAITTISAFMNEHSQRLNAYTAGMTAAQNETNSLPRMKEYIRASSTDLEQLAAQLSPEVEQMASSYKLAVEATSKAMAIVVQIAPEKKSDLSKLADSLTGMGRTLVEYKQSLASANDMLISLPRFSNQFNRARRNVRQVFERQLAYLDNMIEQSTTLVASIRSD